ncbi:hypothetical protein ACSTS3_21550 [Aquimarina muelleri]|uniref:hypothetical protein n=1 Tax=Aquimarina muelleri TaxID=279356 RepID=UPI003F685B4B
MRVIIVLILVLGIASCYPNKLTVADKQKWQADIYGEEPFLKNQVPTVKVNLVGFYNKVGYIFSKEPEPFWGKRYTPTKEDVLIAEEKMKSKYDSLGIKSSFKNYYRQYIGIINNDNKKVVHIQCIKINRICKKKSKDRFLVDKWFFQTHHYDNVFSNSIIID